MKDSDNKDVACLRKRFHTKLSDSQQNCPLYKGEGMFLDAVSSRKRYDYSSSFLLRSDLTKKPSEITCTRGNGASSCLLTMKKKIRIKDRLCKKFKLMEIA